MQVKRVQKDVVELVEIQQVVSSGKRKFLSRKRYLICIKEDNLENYQVFLVKRLCNRRKKEIIDICNSINGGDSKDKGLVLDGMWLILVNELIFVRLVNYVNMLSKMMLEVVL